MTTDPEHWLPMRERSIYKAKRKNKNGSIGKGTQGATGGGTNDNYVSMS